jgi:Trk K+ transport system NAD-binding subunit
VSILLVEPARDIATSVVIKLLDQGEEVRIVAIAPEPEWSDLGAHIARGDGTDADLLERAGQGARTVVLFDPSGEQAAAAVEAATNARIERLVVCSKRMGEEVDVVRTSGLSYVLLLTGRRARNSAADAIDWADDVAGDVKLEVDLRRESVG